MIAKIIPFKIPIRNSFKTFWVKLFFVNWFVAIVLIVTARVCMPALPPIEATIGIKTAKATTFSMSSLKKIKIDPAIASSVFVTTITDVIGFLSFLGVGAYFFYS